MACMGLLRLLYHHIRLSELEVVDLGCACLVQGSAAYAPSLPMYGQEQ